MNNAFDALADNPLVTEDLMIQFITSAPRARLSFLGLTCLYQNGKNDCADWVINNELLDERSMQTVRQLQAQNII